jgi:hypothetical protein
MRRSHRNTAAAQQSVFWRLRGAGNGKPAESNMPISNANWLALINGVNTRIKRGGIDPIVKAGLAERKSAAKKTIRPASSALEKKFDWTWRALKGPPLSAEVRFHETRRWRFDRACIEAKVAFEIQGGVWINGGHSRGVGFTSDCEKLNAAQLAGWTVFKLTADMLTVPVVQELLWFTNLRSNR